MVATPIGNLEDMPPRAIRVLKEADIIACEDSRVTKKLLSSYDIHPKKILSYHDHNEQDQAKNIVEKMQAEILLVALVTDAGTPCISDPGFRLVRLARQNNIQIQTVPGPSSVTALLSVSGLPSDKFSFLGFLPRQEKEILNLFEQLIKGPIRTFVFLESLRRLEKSLKVLMQEFKDSEVVIGRELTKIFEETYCGSIADAYEWVKNHATLKGEVTLAIFIPANEEPVAVEHLKKSISREYAGGKTLRDLLFDFKNCGLTRTDLYQLLLELKPKI